MLPCGSGRTGEGRTLQPASIPADSPSVPCNNSSAHILHIVPKLIDNVYIIRYNVYTKYERSG